LVAVAVVVVAVLPLLYSSLFFHFILVDFSLKIVIN